jgi:hypothetical protein
MSTTPWNARNAASVTTKDGMPSFTTSAPSANPMRTPVARDAPIASGHARPQSVRITAMIEAHTPEANPAERSISPMTRTNTSPIAMHATAAPCPNRFARFPTDRNTGFASPKNTHSAMMPATAGSAPTSPDRTSDQ